MEALAERALEVGELDDHDRGVLRPQGRVVVGADLDGAFLPLSPLGSRGGRRDQLLEPGVHGGQLRLELLHLLGQQGERVQLLVKGLQLVREPLEAGSLGLGLVGPRRRRAREERVSGQQPGDEGRKRDKGHPHQQAEAAAPAPTRLGLRRHPDRPSVLALALALALSSGSPPSPRPFV